MPQLILLKGLPGSGKSTWAKEQVAKSNGKMNGLRFIGGFRPNRPSHIREGVVLRVLKASNGETVFFKAKSSEFYALEDKSKNDGEIDIEEMNQQL